jgi:Mn2+/Fe2+ NRAMP family transporter
MIAANKKVMGKLVNPRWLTALAGALSTLIIALNAFLLVQLAFGP